MQEYIILLACVIPTWRVYWLRYSHFRWHSRPVYWPPEAIWVRPIPSRCQLPLSGGLCRPRQTVARDYLSTVSLQDQISRKLLSPPWQPRVCQYQQDLWFLWWMWVLKQRSYIYTVSPTAFSVCMCWTNSLLTKSFLLWKNICPNLEFVKCQSRPPFLLSVKTTVFVTDWVETCSRTPIYILSNLFPTSYPLGKRRYSIKLWKTFTDCFNCLPIAAIIDDKIFCCHGGRDNKCKEALAFIVQLTKSQEWMQFMCCWIR